MNGSETGVVILYAATWAAMVREGYIATVDGEQG